MGKQRGSILVYAILAIVILGMVSSIGYGIYNAGRKAERAEWEAREAKINAETALKIEAANQAVRAEEQAKAKKLVEISGTLQGKLKEKDHALTVALNAVRAGTVRLSIPVAACAQAGGDPESSAAAGPGGRDGGARAELSDEATRFLTGEASRADKIVEQLISCQAVVRADRAVK